MQRKMNVAVAIATALAVAACADGAASKARVTEPEVSADFVSVAVSCTNSAYASYKRTAGDYSSQRNDPVVTLFGVLQKATTTSARKQAALDILARLDVIRSTGLAKSSLDGGKAAVAAIGCGELGTPPSDALMASAMDLGPDGGVFKMVGGSGDVGTAAVVAAGATPAWGAEPYNTASVDHVATWESAFPNDRVLLYAYRIPTLTGFEGIPLLPPSVAFDMTTAPKVDPIANSLNIFVCAGDSQSRIQSRQFIMTPWAPRYCSTLPDVASNSAQQGFGSQLLAWLSPKPLFASMILIGTGGVKSGWSPKGLVQVDRNLLFIELAQPLVDVQLSAGAIPIKVKAYAKGVSNGSPFVYPTGDIKIVVSVAGNNGIGSDGLIPTATGYTDDDGNVTIPFNTTKTGSFTLRIDGYFVGSPLPVTIITNSFNVRP